MRSIVIAGCLFGCAALTACGKSDRDVDAQSTVSNVPVGVGSAGVEIATGPAAALPTGSPQELEAESSLSVKRGVVTLTAQSRSIRLCGSNVDLTLTDQLDGALDAAYSQLGGKPMYIEMFGERGGATAPGVASASFNIEDLLYATSTNTDTACQTPLGAYELSARGAGPEWSVNVRNNSMAFQRAGVAAPLEFTSVETAETEGAVTYRAGADSHVLELVVTQRACYSNDNSAYFAYSATARFDKQTFNGCARVGD